MRRDRHLPARLRNEAMFRRHENQLHAAIVTAMTEWLDMARALVLHRPLPALTASSDIRSEFSTASVTPDSLTAAAGEQPPDVDAAQASFTAWARALTEHVEPVIEEAFGEAFRANSRVADISPQHFQEEHLSNVHDRLVIWPAGAFEELRPELLEALAEGESMEQVEERIGRILDIDAPARRIRADISAIDRRIADPETPRAELPGLRGRRRDLWNQHDERNLEWQWLARRIARTEIQGAMNGGTLAAARASEEATGRRIFKRWLATTDERVRATHAVADGQIVRLGEAFFVGGFDLQHPADPFGPPQESINCRCSMLIFTSEETQSELQGQWGGLGVGPGHSRLGPDAPADAAGAVERFEAEQDGQVQERPVRVEPDSVPVETVPDPPQPDPVPDPEPDDPDENEPDPIELLDAQYEPVAETATPEQVEAVAVWTRSPERVQRVYEDTPVPPFANEEEDEATAALLDDLMTPLAAPVDTAVATRDVLPILGVPTADLPALTGTQVTVPGPLPTNIADAPPPRVVTTSGGGAAFLRVHAPAGSPALWLPAFDGTPDGALLLAAGTVLAVGAVTYAQGQVPVVEATVVPPEPA